MTTSNRTHSSPNRGFVIAFISAIILSFTGILIRLISQNYGVPALILAFWREIFVVLTLFPFLLFTKSSLLKIHWQDLPFLFLFGAVLAVFNILWTLAVTLTGAAVATVLVYSSAAFTAILGKFFLNEQLGWVKIIAIILCLVGCLFVSGATNKAVWQTNAPGIITGLSSGLLYAIYSLVGRRATQREINPWTSLFYAFLFAATILLTLNLLPLDFLPGTAQNPMEMFMLGDAWLGWLLLVLLAAGPTLLGFGLYNVSLGLLPSSTANLILTSEPVFTTITAYLLLGERLTGPEILGSILILGALVFLRLAKIHEKTS